MPKRKSWASFSEEVVSLYAPPVRRRGTQRLIKSVLDEFAPRCRWVSDLGPAAIAGWIADHPGRRPESVYSKLRSLRAAVTYALVRGYLRVSPFAFRSARAWSSWEAPELPAPVCSSAQVRAILALADREAQTGHWRTHWRRQRLRALVYLLAYTGVRPAEALGLEVADVDLGRGLVSIKSNQGRSLKTRASAASVPIPEPLRPVLAHWIPQTGGEWLFPGTRKRGAWLTGGPGVRALDQVRDLGERAGVKGLTLVSFRHTFASMAELWGLGELALQRLLRHTRLKTQLHYRHEMPAMLADAAGRIRF
jgi:integrase